MILYEPLIYCNKKIVYSKEQNQEIEFFISLLIKNRFIEMNY